MFDAGKVTEEQRARLLWWFLSAVRLAENGFLQPELGVVDDKSWNARANPNLLILLVGRQRLERWPPAVRH